jgi:hypothetical protein
MSGLLGTFKVAALVGLNGALLWKSIVNSACWRTPWTEISGNPLLKGLLVPSVFHIRATAVLDAGLEAFIRARGLVVPAQYKAGGRYLHLDGRIRFLGDQGFLANAAVLDAIRQRRNDLAHDCLAEIDWAVFEANAEEIERTLLHLGLAAEARNVREFRDIAKHLQQPAHRKFYLGPNGMLLAAAVEGATTLLVSRLTMRALLEQRPGRHTTAGR